MEHFVPYSLAMQVQGMAKNKCGSGFGALSSQTKRPHYVKELHMWLQAIF